MNLIKLISLITFLAISNVAFSTHIEISENFIIENNKINFQISTDDRVEYFNYEGEEIIDNIA